jgi:Leucine-rich repeat (LRR) protein
LSFVFDTVLNSSLRLIFRRECHQGLDAQVKLQKFSLQSNRLASIGDGLRHCVQLRELYLSHNGITRIDGLSELVCIAYLPCARHAKSVVPFSHTITFARVSLFSIQIEIRVLDLSNNQISAIEGIDTLVHLQEFWVSPYSLFTAFFVYHADFKSLVSHVKPSLYVNMALFADQSQSDRLVV